MNFVQAVEMVAAKVVVEAAAVESGQEKRS
jgi:hypothetical protein